VSELTVDRCPSLVQLLMAEERELPAQEQLAIDLHTSRCPKCRQQLHEQDHVIREVKEHCRRVFGPDAQRRRFGDFQARLHDLQQASIHHHATFRIRRWLPLAALIPVGFLGLLLLYQSHAAIVQADELLTRAAAVERDRPIGTRQRVRMRLLDGEAPVFTTASLKSSFSFTEELIDGIALASASETIPNGLPSTLALKLQTYHIDPQQPLSVAHFVMVRSALRHRQDNVTRFTGANGTPMLALRTTTDVGDLREAELIVEQNTFHVVSESFVFVGLGRIEIDELAQWIHHPEPLLAATTTTIVAAAAPDRETLDRAELDARLLLGQSGADLPGTVHVAITRELLQIEGDLTDASTRRTMSTRFGGVPYVRMNLHVRDADPSVAPNAASALSRWTERKFPENARTSFLPELLRRSVTVRQRLDVVAELARRYREPEIRQLSATSRTSLQQLLMLHHRALGSEVEALGSYIAVLTRRPQKHVSVEGVQVPSDWRPRSAAARANAIALDRRIQNLLLYDDLPATEQAEIDAAMASLWETLYSPTPLGS
jgi:hypothetical protein